ncbi:hypothetical protein ACX0G9_24990 [Flavitalea flava]
MKIIAICLIAGASLTASGHCFAQISLGATSITRVSSVASVNSPGINNALRATTSMARTTTTMGKTTVHQTVNSTSSTVQGGVNSDVNHFAAGTTELQAAANDHANANDHGNANGQVTTNGQVNANGQLNPEGNVKADEKTVQKVTSQARTQVKNSSDKAVSTGESAVKRASDTQVKAEADTRIKSSASAASH